MGRIHIQFLCFRCRVQSIDLASHIYNANVHRRSGCHQCHIRGSQAIVDDLAKIVDLVLRFIFFQAIVERVEKIGMFIF